MNENQKRMRLTDEQSEQIAGGESLYSEADIFQQVVPDQQCSPYQVPINPDNHDGRRYPVKYYTGK